MLRCSVCTHLLQVQGGYTLTLLKDQKMPATRPQLQLQHRSKRHAPSHSLTTDVHCHRIEPQHMLEGCGGVGSGGGWWAVDFVVAVVMMDMMVVLAGVGGFQLSTGHVRIALTWRTP
jgi:hypothetical protein